MEEGTIELTMKFPIVEPCTSTCSVVISDRYADNNYGLACECLEIDKKEKECKMKLK